MNSNTRDWWPLVYEEAEAAMSVSPKERFPLQHQTICHVRLFQYNIPIVENLNSNVTKLTGRDAHICAFPWKFAGGEAALVRVVGFVHPE
jgi:kynurenine formamidase